MIHVNECPKCRSEFFYEMGRHYICLNCAHDWEEPESEADGAVRTLSDMATVDGAGHSAEEKTGVGAGG